MSKPSLNPNFDKSKLGVGGNVGGMIAPQSYFNYPSGVSSAMMYPPGMQGYPTMNPNFNAAQFFPQGKLKLFL